MLIDPKTLTGCFRLGDLDLDVDQRRLRRQGRDLKLSNLTFKLLHVLASAAPALVTKEELAELVWSGRIVSPQTIAQRIKLLRDALRDSADAPRYIEVVHGQGYRWISAVEQTGPAHNGVSRFNGNPDSPQGIVLELPSQPSVAVLPFDTMGDTQLDHHIFADGLTHDIITCIGRTRGLFVVARGSAFMFRGGEHSVQDVAQKRGVRYVVQGKSASQSARSV